MSGVLIVDDDTAYMDFLVRELSKSYHPVLGVSSGEKAVEEMAKRPQDFRFAVIDHILEPSMDGIETTRELVKICPGLYPVVFSNIPSDNKLMEYKFTALEAGAYRYLEKRDDRPRQISEFAQEMEHLEHLSKSIAGFHETRSGAPSLLTQLDIGMDIIDFHHKVWYMNDAMLRIIGYDKLQPAPCSAWHGHTYFPCDYCLLEASKLDSKARTGIFLSPLIYRPERPLDYVQVWSRVLQDPLAPTVNGQPVPLAVMESVVELTGKPELKAMPLDERLGIIAKAIYSLRERKKYSKNHLFDYVRIYTVDRGGAGAFVLKAVAGMRQPSELGMVTLREVDGYRLQTAVDHMITTGYGYWFAHVDGFDPVMPGEPRIPNIYWPIIQDNTLIALIEVGGNQIQFETAALLIPYANEVVQAIADDHERTPASIAIAEAGKCVGIVDLALQALPQSVEEQLKEIVRQACELTGSRQYVLRYREGDNARLLRLRVPGYNDYEALAAMSYPLTHVQSWSCRTILAGTETLANIADHGNSILAFREKLDERAQQVLKDANALCYEPLLLEGYCIGSLGFHAETVMHYDEKKRAILRLLAKRAAWALQEYLQARAIREKAEADTLADILGVVLHNIKTPLATIQFAFSRLLSAYDKKCKPTPDIEDFVGTIKGELNRIARLQETVVKLRKPWETRLEAALLHKLVSKVVAGRMAGNKVCTFYTLEPSLDQVHIDSAAVEVCLEILVDNSLDALQDTREKKLKIVLRKAEPTEIADDDATGKLAIDVIDNGHGVPPEIAENLFTTLQSSKVHSSGIGLLHGRVIARSAHGDIIYDSTHTPGAKFTLLLPYG